LFICLLCFVLQNLYELRGLKHNISKCILIPCFVENHGVLRDFIDSKLPDWKSFQIASYGKYLGVYIGYDTVHLTYQGPLNKFLSRVALARNKKHSLVESVISFNVEGIHPYDIGTILDKLGIAVRTGHHCAQPVMDYFKVPGTVRASFSFYNTKNEVDILVEGVKKAIQMLR